MTLREKVAAEEPDSVNNIYKGGVKGCPRCYSFLNNKCDIDEMCFPPTHDCNKCWEQEFISTKPARISKDEYYLEIAKAVSLRSTCIRRQYGAVLVKNDHIISTGYNGSARGETNCCDVGTCYREANNIPHGEQYEKCVAVHAEDNAISQAGRAAYGATLYLAGFENGKLIDAKPCLMCERKIKNAGIRRIVGSDAE